MMKVIVEFSEEDPAVSRERWESVKKILVDQYIKNLPAAAGQKSGGDAACSREKDRNEKEGDAER